jgi:hypothetical protein
MRRGGLDAHAARTSGHATLPPGMCNPLISLGFSLLIGHRGSSRLDLPGCLTPIACEAGQERLRLI